MVRIFSKGFLIVAARGTFASLLGCPTANIIIGLSDVGLLHILVRNFIGFGVCTRQYNPAWCIAEIRNPAALRSKQYF